MKRRFIACTVMLALIATAPGPEAYAVAGRIFRVSVNTPLGGNSAAGAAASSSLPVPASPGSHGLPDLIPSASDNPDGPKSMPSPAVTVPEIGALGAQVVVDEGFHAAPTGHLGDSKSAEGPVPTSSKDDSAASGTPGITGPVNQSPRMAGGQLVGIEANSRRIAANPNAFSDGEVKNKSDFTAPIVPNSSDIGQPAPAVLAAQELLDQGAKNQNPGSFLARALGAVGNASGMVRHIASGDPELKDIQKPYRAKRLLAIALLVADSLLGSIVLPMLAPTLLKPALVAAGFTSVWALLSASLIAVFLIFLLVEKWHTYLVKALNAWVDRDTRKALHKNILAQEMKFFAQNPSGTLAKRHKDDTSFLAYKNEDVYLNMLHYLIYVVFGSIALIYTHWLLGAIILIAVPLAGILAGRYSYLWTHLNLELENLNADIMAQSQEVLQQIEIVHSLNTMDAEAQRYELQAESIRELRRREARLSANYEGAVLLAAVYTEYFVFIFGGWILAASLGLDFGLLNTMMLLAVAVKYGFWGQAEDFLKFIRYEGATQIVRALLRRKSAMEDPPSAQAVQSIQDPIHFKDVTFAYDESAEPVLNGLSLEVPDGKTVAIVGESGSGKSTVARLLFGLYKPDSGTITVGGQDLNSLRRQSLLSHMAIVSQDTSLVQGTLADNVKHWRKHATDKEVEEAIHLANAEFVYNTRRFPQGLNTWIPEGDKRLSGGERQRIMIARAILKKPALLVLDEPSRALDNISERAFQKALKNLRASRTMTILMISHRLLPVRDADSILVMKKGQVVEKGTHKKLMADKGEYHKLWTEESAQRKKTKPSRPGGSSPTAKVGQLSPAKANSGLKAGFSAGVEAPPIDVEPRTEVFSHQSGKISSWLRRLWQDAKNLILGDKVVRPYLRPYRWAIIVAASWMVLQTFSALTGVYLMWDFLNAADLARGALLEHGPRLAFLSVSALGAFVCMVYAARKQSLLTAIVQADLTKDLSVTLNRIVLNKGMDFHGNKDSATLASRLSDDPKYLSEKHIGVRLPLVKDFLLAGSMLILMWNISPTLSLVVFPVALLIGVINGIYGQRFERLSEESTNKKAELTRQAQQDFSQAETVKMSGQEEEYSARFSDKAQDLAQVQEREARTWANDHMFGSGITDFFTKYQIYILAPLFIGLGGDIVAMITCAGLFKDAVDSLSKKWMRYKQTHGATILGRKWLKEKSDRSSHTVELPPLEREIRFEEVTYGYDPKTLILSNVSFTVKAGETLGIVGESGSGKSTIFKLLRWFDSPQQGRITFDGRDIRDAPPASLRRQLAVVTQDTPLFGSRAEKTGNTLHHNLLYGSEGISEEELLQAIRAARAEFVLEKGWDAVVGERGGLLSGGQRQRIAIVRAILRLMKGASVLLLDEFTSAVDKQTAREIQHTLRELSEGQLELGLPEPTALVISHDLEHLSTYADRILVLGKDGRIAEQGTHQELLDKKGKYYELWMAPKSEP